jgi:hypothetical protein
MRMRILIASLMILAAGPASGVRAQTPLPFAPEPDTASRPQCTRDYVQSVRRMLDAAEKLRDAGPEAVGRICSLIDLGSIWFGGKLPDAIREELRPLLGDDVDFERLKTQCRAGQDALASELDAGLARIKAELRRCDDTI